MSNKRMGGLGKLSDFGKSAPSTPPSSEAEFTSTKIEPPLASPEPPHKKQEKPVVINIKIAREQQEWLANTAQQVRDNNDVPVPAGDRCYPQHLIQVAIDLLATASVDWSKVRNIEDLRKHLNL